MTEHPFSPHQPEHDLLDQVRLLEEAGVLDGNRRLRAQHAEHRFVRIGEFAALFVHHLQHPHHFVLCDERYSQQGFGGIPDGLVYFAEDTFVFFGVVDAQRFAVQHDPAGDAFIERDDKPAHRGIVYVGGDLKI